MRFYNMIALSLLVVSSVACSKGGGGSSAPAKTTTSSYTLRNNICYNSDNQAVSSSYCSSGESYSGGVCDAFVVYRGFSNGQPIYVDVVDCRYNAYYVECQDPDAYRLPNEVVTCQSTFPTGPY